MKIIHLENSLKPDVTVIIPTKDRPLMLREALKSVVEQDYEGVAEVLVIDDGSKNHDAEAICQAIPNVQYQRFERNQGHCAIRNIGIERARGHYVAFLDDDDLWEPEHLTTQIKALRGKNNLFSVSGIIRWDVEESKLEDRSQRPNLHKYVSPAHQLLVMNFIRTPSSVVFPKNIFKKVGLFDPTIRVGGDTDFYLRCLMNGYQPFFTILPTVRCRIHSEGQLTDFHNGIERNKNRIHRIRKYYSSLKTQFPLVSKAQIIASIHFISYHLNRRHQRYVRVVFSLLFVIYHRFIAGIVNIFKETDQMVRNQKNIEEFDMNLVGDKINEHHRIKKSPLVSVIMPAYNAEGTICEAIQSVLKQSLQDFELIVVNDGSEDLTVAKVQSFSDSKIHLINCLHRGAAACRNEGLKNSVGEYVSFLDADDLWHPLKLELQLKNLLEHPHAALSYCWVDHIDERGYYLRKGRRDFRNGNVYKMLLIDDFIGGGSNPLIVKDALIKVGGFNEALEAAQDWDTWLRLAKSFPIAHVPIPLVYYRQSSQSISTQYEKMESSSLKVIEGHYASLPQEIQKLKRFSLANRYRYFAQKAFGGRFSLVKWRYGLRFIGRALSNDYLLIFQSISILINLLKRRMSKREPIGMSSLPAKIEVPS